MADDVKDEKQASVDAADLLQTYFTDLTRAMIDTQATFALKIYGIAAQTARDMRSRQISRKESDAASKARDAARLAETQMSEGDAVRGEKPSRRDYKKDFAVLSEKDHEAEERELDEIERALEEAERAGKIDPLDADEGRLYVRDDGTAFRGQARRVYLFSLRKFKPPANKDNGDVIQAAARKLSAGRTLAGPRDVDAADKAIACLYAEFPWFETVLTDLMAQLRASAGAGDGAAWRPMLFVGPPGIGKTKFTTRLAKVLGMYFERHDCGGQDDPRALAGTARGWASAEFAAPVRALLACESANPVLFLDEIEKHGRPFVPHYSAANLVLPWLETSSASTWRDPFLLAPVDVSFVQWVFGANSLKGLPAPFLSRVSVYEIPSPRPQHFDALFASIVRDIEEMERKRTGPLCMMKDESDELERDLIEPEAVEYLRERFVRESLSARELAKLVKKASDATPRKRGAVTTH